MQGMLSHTLRLVSRRPMSNMAQPQTPVEDAIRAKVRFQSNLLPQILFDLKKIPINQCDRKENFVILFSLRMTQDHAPFHVIM